MNDSESLIALRRTVPDMAPDSNGLIAAQLDVLRKNMIDPVTGIREAIGLSLLSLTQSLNSSNPDQHADLIVAYHNQWVLLVNKLQHGDINETMFLKALLLLYHSKMDAIAADNPKLSYLIKTIVPEALWEWLHSLRSSWSELPTPIIMV